MNTLLDIFRVDAKFLLPSSSRVEANVVAWINHLIGNNNRYIEEVVLDYNLAKTNKLGRVVLFIHVH